MFTEFINDAIAQMNLAVGWMAVPGLDGGSIALIMAGLLFWRHAANIARLSAGTEGKIGGGKKTDAH